MTSTPTRSESPSRIGIFGGTFDPVHFGHLRPALELCESLALDVVRLLPCHLPAHRDSPGASTEQRVAMLELAIEGAEGLQVDTRETLRDSPSYSVETLETFRAEYPKAQLVFFMGMDAFASFSTWYRYEDVLELAHLVVVDRPGAKVDDREERLLMSRQVSSLEEANGIAGSIVLQQVSQSDISATRIRHLVAAGRDIRFLVPESVRQFILEQGLYRT